jgi:hypothetical protein
MKIQEFYSKLTSADDSSFLFAVLRRLSLLDEIASLSMEDMAWVGWPPDPGTGTPMEPPPARA